MNGSRSPTERFPRRHAAGTRRRAVQGEELPLRADRQRDRVNDPAKIAEIVAAKGTPDLAKLRRMLAAVNDTQQPIDDVVAHYFNRENYVTWLAVNVLMADYDSTHQNFMLYSPPGFEGWYFLPWDYDGAWGVERSAGCAAVAARGARAIANWWSVVLHRRFLSEPTTWPTSTARVSELASTRSPTRSSARDPRPPSRPREDVHRRAARHRAACPATTRERPTRSGVGSGIRAHRREPRPCARRIRRTRRSPDAILAQRPDLSRHRGAVTVLVEPGLPAARSGDHVRHRRRHERGLSIRAGVVAEATDLGRQMFTTARCPPGTTSGASSRAPPPTRTTTGRRRSTATCSSTCRDRLTLYRRTRAASSRAGRASSRPRTAGDEVAGIGVGPAPRRASPSHRRWVRRGEDRRPPGPDPTA